MTKTVDKQGALSTNSALHITNPLSSRALFWRSRYMVESDFLHHLPFTFWLADVLRPTSIVEIGLEDAQSYFSLCQAVDRLNLPARCHGIFFTPRAEDAKEEDKARLEQIARVQHYNTENYAEFSKLSTRPETEAFNRFADQSVDLLVLGANQSAEALERTLELCDQKLSERAVVLLRGFPDAFEDDQLHMLAQNFIDRHDTLLFEDGTGLAAVLAGPRTEDRLAQLASLKNGSADYNSIHLVFSRLGQAHYNEWTSRTNRARSEKAHNELDVSQRKHSKLTAEFNQLTKAYDARSEAIATAQAENFDLNQQLAKMRAAEKEAAAIAKDRVAWKEKYKVLDKTATQSAASLETLEAKIKKMRAEADQQKTLFETLQAEATALTQKLETQASEIQTAQARADEADTASNKQREAHQAEITDLTQKLAATTEKADAAQARADEADTASQKRHRTHLAEVTVLTRELEAQTIGFTQKLAAMSEKADAAQARADEADTASRKLREAHQAEITTLTQKLEAQASEIQAAKTRADKADTASRKLREAHQAEITTLTQKLEAQAAEIQAAQARADEADATSSQQRETHLTEITALTQKLERGSLEIKGHRMHVKQLEEALSQTLSASEEQKSIIHKKTEKSAYDDQYRQVQIRLRQIQNQRLSKPKGRLSALIGHSEEPDAKRQAEMVRRHSLFDEEWYLANYPDVRTAGVDPALHFVTAGVYEGRNPGPGFNTVDYYVRHPDKLEGDINPLMDSSNKAPEVQK